MSDWTAAPTPFDELERLSKLERLGVRLDQPHAFLDAITAVAARDLGAPIALVSMVDAHTQWFLSRHGLEATHTGRAESFCGHAVTLRAPLMVKDALEDPRFARNPLVVGGPEVRAYLGVPLFTGPAQSGIGTLCIIDHAPREWTQEQIDHVGRLALLVETYLDGLAYRRAWDDSPLSLVILDGKGRCLRVNPAFGRMLGRPVSAIQEQPLASFVLPADRTVLDAMVGFTLAQRQSPTRRELRFSRLTGEIVSGGVSMSPLAELEGEAIVVIRDISLERRTTARSGVVEAVRRELQEPLERARALAQGEAGAESEADRLGTIDGLIAHFSGLLDARIGDIAARARAEAELAASEQRLRSLVEQVLGPLLVLDDRGRIVDANNGALAELGWSYDALVGLSMRKVQPSFTDGTCARWFRAAAALAAGGALEVTTFVRRNGSELRVELRLMRMDWNGPDRLVVIARDITAAHVREVALQAERDDLALQLQLDRTTLDELQRMDAALKASVEEKETMLKEIHHRVKNNLQMVSSLLMLQMDQVTNEQDREAFADSVRRVRSMALIHQHLYGSASLEQVDIGAYANHLVDALRVTLAPRARVRIDRETSCYLKVDRAVPLGLILNELLTNALKYGTQDFDHAGDPAPAAQPDAEWDVRVSVEAGPRELRLTVADRGPGLPEGFRIEGHASLGLQLVTTLTRQLRGVIRARSDGGALFELTVPL